MAGMLFTGISILLGFSRINGPASPKEKGFIIVSALLFAAIWPLFLIISILAKDKLDN